MVFGAHNLLWNSDGNMTVVDFEYGGWDNPLWRLADFLLHEQSCKMDTKLKELFLTKYTAMIGMTPEQDAEYHMYYALAEMMWLSSMLCSVTPEWVQKRRFSTFGMFNKECQN